VRILFQKSLAYFRAGKLLHMISLVFAVISFILGKKLFQSDGSTIISQLSLGGAITFFFTNSILAELDARSRYQNYKQVKDQLFMNGYSERILRPMLKSMCQRDAVLLAAKELEMGMRCEIYFKRNGYRWYHVIPDFIFHQPQFLFSKYFWRSTFFTPEYRARINFYETAQSEIAL
jgi:hypothetical protein